MDRQAIFTIAKKYCYQLICQGDQIWPNVKINGISEEDLKNEENDFCQPFKDLNYRVSLKSPSQSLEKVVPFLIYILAKLEDERIKPYDARRLPLPVTLLTLASYHHIC